MPSSKLFIWIDIVNIVNIVLCCIQVTLCRNYYLETFSALMRCSSVTIFLLSMSSSPSLRYAQNSLASPSRKSLTKSQRGTRMYDSLISLMRLGITLPHSTWILSRGKSKDKKQKYNAERMHRSLTFNDTWNSRDGVIISAKSNQELKLKLNISRNGYWTTQA